MTGESAPQQEQPDPTPENGPHIYTAEDIARAIARVRILQAKRYGPGQDVWKGAFEGSIDDNNL